MTSVEADCADPIAVVRRIQVSALELPASSFQPPASSFIRKPGFLFALVAGSCTARRFPVATSRRSMSPLRVLPASSLQPPAASLQPPAATLKKAARLPVHRRPIQEDACRTIESFTVAESAQTGSEHLCAIRVLPATRGMETTRSDLRCRDIDPRQHRRGLWSRLRCGLPTVSVVLERFMQRVRDGDAHCA
jgi:hypothetical protein